jgi:hypothetical protein
MPKMRYASLEYVTTLESEGVSFQAAAGSALMKRGRKSGAARAGYVPVGEILEQGKSWRF